MTIVACPRCTDQVVMPRAASPRATVRCPLCQAEFSLAEILDRLPPALIVVSDPEPAPVAATALAGDAAAPVLEARITAVRETDVVGEGLDLVELAAPAEAESSDWGASPAFAVADRPRVGEDTTAAAAARKRKISRRAQRKPRHPLVEGIKVVLGGFAGLAFAQMLLWWLPGKYSQDPFKLGPKVARAIPWVVPPSFRGSGAAAPQAQPDSPPAEPRQAALANPKATPQATPKGPNNKKPVTKPPTDSGLPQIKFTDQVKLPDGDSPSPSFQAAPPQNNDDETDEEPAPTMASEATEEEPDLSSLAPDNPLGGLMPKPDLGTDDIPAVKPVAKDPPPEKTAPAPAEERRTPAIKNAPQRSAEDLKAALAEARTGLDAWQSAEPDDKKPLANGYLAVAKLTETLAYTASAGAEDADSAKTLLQSLANDTKKLDFIAEIGSLWVQSPKPRSDGVLVVGTVKQISRQGKLFQTQLEVSGGRAPITLCSDVDPASTYQEQARLLAAGVIVREPAKQLNGYEGSAELVIWLQTSQVVESP